jgi:fatty acyl-CoA reductase
LLIKELKKLPLYKKSSVWELTSARTQKCYFLFDIVTSTVEDPFPGWVDNFNGPVGIMVAGGKGILRVTYGDPNAKSDYVPVDVCTKFMLIAAWQKAVLG